MAMIERSVFVDFDSVGGCSFASVVAQRPIKAVKVHLTGGFALTILQAATLRLEFSMQLLSQRSVLVRVSG